MASLATRCRRRTEQILLAICCQSMSIPAIYDAPADPLCCSDIGLPEMQAKLGDDSGTWLWEIIRGIDYTEGVFVLVS